MMRGLGAALFGLYFASPAAAAPPGLDATQLFTANAKGCVSVDLTSWHHPTRSVLEGDGVGINKVELCNDRKYPVFHVRFPYAPQGPTQSYFHPLYARMAVANGFWPFAFVSAEDAVIITASPQKDRSVSIAYEAFTP